MEYRRHFSDEQIQVVFLEDLTSNSDAVLQACCSFLNIDPSFKFADPDEVRNASAGKGLATGLGRVLRSIPGYSTLVGWIPDVVRTVLQPLIKDTFNEKPDWKPSAGQEWTRVLEGDMEAFLDYANKPYDHWSL